MKSDTQIAAEYFESKSKELARFFQVVNDLGDQLNSRKLRFDKSDVLEIALSGIGPELKWVDEEGYDLILQHEDREIKIEVKTMKNSLYYKKGMRDTIGDIKVKNTLKKDFDENETFETDACYAIVETNCVRGCIAFLSPEDVRKSKRVHDGFVLKGFAVEDSRVVYDAPVCTVDTSLSIDYAEKKLEAQKSIAREYGLTP